MTAVDLDVVIPAYNEEASIAACLDAIAGQTASPTRIIVVDNGSTDATAAIAARYPGVDVVIEPQTGSYAARNAGLRWSSAPIVAFTDADCRPRSDWLAAAMASLASSGADLVGGRIDHGKGGNLAERYDQVAYLHQDTYVSKLHFGATANLVVRREVLDALHGFDAGLQSGGDLDFGRRAHVAGFRITYAADAVVDHRPRSSLRALARRSWRIGVGHAAIEDPQFRSWAYSPKRLLPSRTVVRDGWRDPAVVAVDAVLSWVSLAGRLHGRRAAAQIEEART